MNTTPRSWHVAGADVTVTFFDDGSGTNQLQAGQERAQPASRDTQVQTETQQQHVDASKPTQQEG